MTYFRAMVLNNLELVIFGVVFVVVVGVVVGLGIGLGIGAELED